MKATMLWALLIIGARGNHPFEFFRCDACHASFFQINAKLQEMKEHRTTDLRLTIPEWVNLVDEVCDSEAFSKHNFGVKQYEEKSYLFGPGVPDHLGPDKGFGQMGMGDYDLKLAGFCRLFVEEVGEEALRDR